MRYQTSVVALTVAAVLAACGGTGGGGGGGNPLTPLVALKQASTMPFPAADFGAVGFGDVNGDGAPDIVAGMRGGQGARVFLSARASFSWRFAVDTFCPSDPGAFAIGDFDGDGFADIAFTQPDLNAIGIAFGDGTGERFEPVFMVPAVQRPTGLAVGDWNGDGMADLASMSSGGDRLLVFLGHGDGTFQASFMPTAVERGPTDIVAFDTDMDGNPDLAVACHDAGTVRLFFGDGAGGFVENPTNLFCTGVERIAVGDVNDDHFPDLHVTLGDGSVKTFHGDGAGGFDGGTVLGRIGSPFLPMLGDFRGDGETAVGFLGRDVDAVFFHWGVSSRPDGYLLVGPNSVASFSFDWDLDGFSDVAVLASDHIDVYQGAP